jgi:antitoxin CcdA
MSGTRRSTEVTIDSSLVDEALSMDVDLSRAAEAGIARALAAKKAAQQFAEDHTDVISSNNDYVARHGLPLRRYRSF